MSDPLPTRFAVLPEVLAGETADVYFLRTRVILTQEGIDPIVTMEFFAGRAAVLCGIREACEFLKLALGEVELAIEAMDEGASIERKQVVLRLTGRYLAFGIYETALLGMLSQSTGWATAARVCVEAAGSIPVYSFGARHVHPRVAPILDYAAIVGGCVSGSTPAGSHLAGREPAGTMPHALILIIGDTVAAAEAFDRIMPPEVPRTVLVDTFHDEAEESVRVAAALGAHLQGVRLDTPSERGGVTVELVREVRARLDLAFGHEHGTRGVGIFVSGGLTPERLRQFRDSGVEIAGFGVGSAIADASPIDFTADIKAIGGHPVAKRGRIPGITPNPALHPVHW
ncbi:MAG TPA: nicotinate phosphoribosyltransferase [Chloroflexota bacterium]|nr:nicotinate phosphoribosyltransferase [Chloroflexota bacterium]